MVHYYTYSVFFCFLCFFVRGTGGVFFVCFVTAEGCPLYSIDLFRYLGGEFGEGAICWGAEIGLCDGAHIRSI